VRWAACLLINLALAAAAVTALATTEHTTGSAIGFERLIHPGENDRRAVPLLRYPDLLAPVGAPHQPLLLECLQAEAVRVTRPPLVRAPPVFRL
jgi:hypothetical protein